MLRRIAATSFIVLLASVVLLLAAKARADARFFEGYDAGIPLRAEESESWVVDGTQELWGVECRAHYRLEKVYFEARPGERVPTLVTLPLDFEGRAPAVVFLHGSDQEKEAVEKICTPFNEAGFVMACYDQHMCGERKVEGGFVTTMRAVRERTWKTIHDTRRLIDYLVTRPDIDPERIYLAGASYGAITGTTVVAHEPRIKAAILVVGGGNFSLMGESPAIRRELPAWAVPWTRFLLTSILGVADPVLAAPHTGGTPVLMQNGTKDDVVVPAAGEALYEALAEPKEIRWYPVEHPDTEENGYEVLRMLDEGLTWLVEQDAPFRKETSPAQADQANAGPATSLS